MCECNGEKSCICDVADIGASDVLTRKTESGDAKSVTAMSGGRIDG